MKLRDRLLAAWRVLTGRTAYVVLYENAAWPSESDEYDQWHGYFDTPDEALALFMEAFGGRNTSPPQLALVYQPMAEWEDPGAGVAQETPTAQASSAI